MRRSAIKQTRTATARPSYRSCVTCSMSSQQWKRQDNEGEAYNKLTQEAARLTNALGDARKQAQILSHDNAGLRSNSGVSGLTGAFCSARSRRPFSGEAKTSKDNVASTIAHGITIGLQQ